MDLSTCPVEHPICSIEPPQVAESKRGPMNHSVSVTVTPWVGWRWFVNSWYCDKAFLWCLRRTVQLPEILSCGFKSVPGNPRNHVGGKGKHARPGSLSAAQHGWSLEGASPLLPSFLLCAPSMAGAFTGSGPVTPAAGAPPHRPS